MYQHFLRLHKLSWIIKLDVCGMLTVGGGDRDKLSHWASPAVLKP